MQDHEVKITWDYVLKLEDLMKTVDTKVLFTLDRIFGCIAKSDIDPELLCRLLRCPYVYDLIMESTKGKPDPDSEIEYLELSYALYKHTFRGKCEDSSGWIFDGVGRAGVLPEDLKDQGYVVNDPEWRQRYAIEMTPVYELKDYVIRIRPEMPITNYDTKSKDMKPHFLDEVPLESLKVKPSITLMELLYGIFWELTFFGGPENRNAKSDELSERLDDFKEAKEKGEVKYTTVDFDDPCGIFGNFEIENRRYEWAADVENRKNALRLLCRNRNRLNQKRRSRVGPRGLRQGRRG